MNCLLSGWKTGLLSRTVLARLFLMIESRSKERLSRCCRDSITGRIGMPGFLGSSKYLRELWSLRDESSQSSREHMKELHNSILWYLIGRNDDFITVLARIMHVYAIQSTKGYDNKQNKRPPGYAPALTPTHRPQICLLSSQRKALQIYASQQLFVLKVLGNGIR